MNYTIFNTQSISNKFNYYMCDHLESRTIGCKSCITQHIEVYKEDRCMVEGCIMCSYLKDKRLVR